MLFRDEKKIEEVDEQDFQKWLYETEENAKFFVDWLAYHYKSETTSVGKALDKLSRDKSKFNIGYKATVGENVTALAMFLYDTAKTQLWDDAKKLTFKESKK